MKIMGVNVKRFIYKDGFWLITFVHNEHEQEVMADTLPKTIGLIRRMTQ